MVGHEAAGGNVVLGGVQPVGAGRVVCSLEQTKCIGVSALALNEIKHDFQSGLLVKSAYKLAVSNWVLVCYKTNVLSKEKYSKCFKFFI